MLGYFSMLCLHKLGSNIKLFHKQTTAIAILHPSTSVHIFMLQAHLLSYENGQQHCKNLKPCTREHISYKKHQHYGSNHMPLTFHNIIHCQNAEYYLRICIIFWMDK